MLNMAFMAAEDGAKNLSWAVDIFTFIGIVVCIITAAIALVWLTCFVVRLLVKTFGSKINESYNVYLEDMKKKAESKKERNNKKREAKDAQKMELLNMKLESKARIHEMKKDRLEGTLSAKEAEAKAKIFGEDAPNYVSKPKVKVEKKEVEEKQEKESEEVFENIADVAEIVDGEVGTIDVIKPEEDEKKPAKKTAKKK